MNIPHRKVQGVSCHQCKNTKPHHALAHCSNMFDKRNSKSKRVSLERWCEKNRIEKIDLTLGTTIFTIVYDHHPGETNRAQKRAHAMTIEVLIPSSVCVGRMRTVRRMQSFLLWTPHLSVVLLNVFIYLSSFTSWKGSLTAGVYFRFTHCLLPFLLKMTSFTEMSQEVLQFLPQQVLQRFHRKHPDHDVQRCMDMHGMPGHVSVRGMHSKERKG